MCTFLCFYIKQYPQEKVNISKGKKIKYDRKLCNLGVFSEFCFLIETYILTNVMITSNKLAFFQGEYLKSVTNEIQN